MRYAARAFQVADASCLRMKPRKPFRRGPGAKAARAGGSVNLRVDGKPLLDRPCRRDHRYATGYRPSTTKQLRLRMVNDRARSAGRIVVLVSLPKTNVSAGLPRR
jgi:hypothetical protein